MNNFNNIDKLSGDYKTMILNYLLVLFSMVYNLRSPFFKSCLTWRKSAARITYKSKKNQRYIFDWLSSENELFLNDESEIDINDYMHY